MAGALPVVTQTLIERVKETTGPQIADRFIGGTHTQRFDDNLLPTLTLHQARRLRRQLAAGSGNELTPRKGSGKRTGHAPYSSAALAANAWGIWLGHEQRLVVAGLTGFESLQVEGRLQMAHGGGLANLDVLLEGPDLVAGVESKLCETLTEHDPVTWKDPYKQAPIRELLDDAWAAVLDLSLEGAWQLKQLGLEQLIKHALALRSTANGRQAHLVYVFWEPERPQDVTESREHRAELAQLTDRLVGAQPQLHAFSYAQLFSQWDALIGAVPHLAEHLAALRGRYTITV